MWTNENRARYDRSRLRYPSDLSDDEWKLVEPSIPPGKRGGDKRTVIMREVVNGLDAIFSPRLSSGGLSRKTCRRAATLYDYFDLWSWDGTLDRHTPRALCKMPRSDWPGSQVPPPPSSTAKASKALKKGGFD